MVKRVCGENESHKFSGGQRKIPVFERTTILLGKKIESKKE